jgi:hypothetical protein
MVMTLTRTTTTEAPFTCRLARAFASDQGMVMG